MGRWHVITDKKRDESTGKWLVQFFAVSPNGIKFPYASYTAAQLKCKQEENHGLR